MQIPRLAFRLALGKRLPTTRNELRLEGPRAPLTIRRDRYAIPYIDAANDEDAWFGFGFCQAQDRAFQLELRLRTIRGTLSQLFGEQTLGIDRLARRIGFYEASQRQVDVLDDDVRTQIEAFVRGINAAYDAGWRRQPLEFALLRSRPTRWSAADVLGVGKLVSFLLIGNWDVELARLKILTLDGPEALRDLDPTYQAEHPVTSPPEERAGPALDRLSEDLERFVAFAGQGGGSNSWALSGSRTASGRPLLANDPHLEASLPSHWYLAHLKTPTWAVAGAGLVGAPAIGAGHNGHAAWGITASLVDTVDLFIEDVGPDGASVRHGDGYEACERRTEVIEVKGRTPVTEDVLVTPRGPIIGPALWGDVGAVSLRAVWLDAKPARGFLTAHKARSFEAFRRSFEAWPLLSQNVVYADVGGTIGWQLVGEAPRRRQGWGTLPLPGRDVENGWYDDGVPFSEMPSLIDPATGFVATANNKPVRDGDGPYLGVDWLDGYRVRRFDEALTARSDWDVDATLKLQMDETSLTWREVREGVLVLAASDADAGLGLELLRAWDGVLSADSSAASVFELFVAEMWRRVARSRAPKASRWALGEGFTHLLPLTTFTGGRASTILRRLREQPPGWFERGWPLEMADALSAVVRDLRGRWGPRVEDWAWGSIRPLTLEHPLGRIPQLAALFNRGPYPWGGDGNTVSQAGTTPGRLTNPQTIASLRMVMDVGAWEGSRFVMPGGQSGNPLSAHYDDLLPLWLRGEGVPIAWPADAVERAAVDTLRLWPLRG